DEAKEQARIADEAAAKERAAAAKERDLASDKARMAEGEIARLDKMAQRQRYLAQIVRVASIWDRDPERGLKLLQDEEICKADERDFAWGFYRKLCTTELGQLKGHADPVVALAVSPDGKLAASAAGEI